MVDWNGEAWCSVHQCPPTECFHIHNPHASDEGRSETAKQMRKRIKRQHKAKQRELSK